jgi:hypothetical protein
MLTFLQHAALHASVCTPRVLRVIVCLMQFRRKFSSQMTNYVENGINPDKKEKGKDEEDNDDDDDDDVSISGDSIFRSDRQ